MEDVEAECDRLGNQCTHWLHRRNGGMVRGAKQGDARGQKICESPFGARGFNGHHFCEGLCTNEHAEVPRASKQHAHAGSDGSSDPEPKAVFEPASLSRKRSGGAAGAMSGPESKKTRSSTADECMLRIANAYEQTVSQARVARPDDNVDSECTEVHWLMQQVVAHGYAEGTDEHYYAAIMLYDKRVRDAMTGFCTAEGRAGYLRRMWPFFQSRGGLAFP